MTPTPNTDKTRSDTLEGPLSLAVALRRLGVERDPGHCGEGSVERLCRDKHNEAVDVVLAALQTGEQETEGCEPQGGEPLKIVSAEPGMFGADIFRLTFSRYLTAQEQERLVRATSTALLAERVR